jgi:MFS family permease
MIKSNQTKKTGHHAPIYLLSFVVLFWAIFDGTMSYITPLIIDERGFSKSMIGLLISTSSIMGALFDFVICKLFRNINFRRIFLIMFILCAIYPLVLWHGGTIWIFLIAMAIWGIYWDLYGFGIFNFIGRYTKKDEHSANFGTIQVFKSLGIIIAPLIAGLVLAEGVGWKPFALGWIFITISIFFFITLTIITRKNNTRVKNFERHPKRKNLFVELYLWKKIGRKLLPVLILTFFLFVIDAFFWTLGPMYAVHLNLKQFSGLFLMAYTLPPLAMGWFVAKFTKRIGKKRTAFYNLLIGSLFLSFFMFLPNIYFIIPIILISSCFITMALPAINAAYADFIYEAPKVEGEIEGLEDFAFNIGYVIGPLCAGILADIFSIPIAFSILGVVGFTLALILLKITPKKINILPI